MAGAVFRSIGLNGYGATALAVISLNVKVLIVVLVLFLTGTENANALLAALALAGLTALAIYLLVRKQQVSAFFLALPEAITYVLLVVAVVVAVASQNSLPFARL